MNNLLAAFGLDGSEIEAEVHRYEGDDSVGVGCHQWRGTFGKREFHLVVARAAAQFVCALVRGRGALLTTPRQRRRA